MATNTAKLGLRKPSLTDIINVTTDISDNMQKIDDYIQNRKHRTTRNSAGNISAITNGYQDYNNALDIVLDAVAGNMVELSINAFIGAGGGPTSIGVVTVNGATLRNTYGNVNALIYCQTNTLARWQGTITYPVVAGDIDVNGQVRFRVRYQQQQANTIYADASYPFSFSASNKGTP